MAVYYRVNWSYDIADNLTAFQGLERLGVIYYIRM